MARKKTSTTAGVLRPQDFARHATLDRYDAPDDLAPWVENHWSVRWDLPPGTSYVSATLPHPACNLGVEQGQRREGVDVPVVVTGVPTRRFDVTLRGSGWVHGVKFRPGGLTSLTGVSAKGLRNRTVPAGEVLPPHLVEPLAELTQEECRDGLDEMLRSLRTEPEPDYRTVLDVVAAMLDDRSLIRVAQVEERCSVSTRSLQRLFARYVGVTPKWVLARYRMHDVVTALDEGYDGSLADLAAAYGWFDQAHFTREFTDLVGVPPSTYTR